MMPLASNPYQYQQPMQNQYQQRLDMMQQQQQYQQLRQYDIVHVNGENGARAFRMLPNSRALLMDDTAPIIWFVQSDGAGYHTQIPFDIKEHKAEATMQSDLESRIKRLEDIVNAQSNNAVYEPTANAQNTRDNGTATTDQRNAGE